MCLVTHFYAVVVVALTFTIVWLTKLNCKSPFFKKRAHRVKNLSYVFELSYKLCCFNDDEVFFWMSGWTLRRYHFSVGIC